jgi:hypothetical protein
MLRDFSWFHPAPRNFVVDKRRQRVWKRWAKFYRATPGYKLLEQIEAARPQVASKATERGVEIFWLLPFRRRFRRTFARLRSIGQEVDVEAIRYYMAFCSTDMIPICIWLIGKCGVRFHAYDISQFCSEQPSQIRKHVAKALRRLEARWLLEEMAGRYRFDEAIQRFADSPVIHQPFPERLSRYVQSVDDSHADEVVTPSRMPFWSLEKSWDYTPPKSVLAIRRMLRRIRHWVRWGVG